MVRHINNFKTLKTRHNEEAICFQVDPELTGLSVSCRDPGKNGHNVTLSLIL